MCQVPPSINLRVQEQLSAVHAALQQSPAPVAALEKELDALLSQITAPPPLRRQVGVEWTADMLRRAREGAGWGPAADMRRRGVVA
jgi:hypothetical protein